MDKNRIEGAAKQGERARNCKALVIKTRWRKSGGCAAKECVLAWGDLALGLKRATVLSRSEKSAEAVVAAGRGRRAERVGGWKVVSLERAVHQKPVSAGRIAEGRMASRCWWRNIRIALNRASPSPTPTVSVSTDLMTSAARIARCGPACRVVWEGTDHVT